MKRIIIAVLCVIGMAATMAAAPIAARADQPICTFMTMSYLIEANKDRIVKLHTVEGDKFKTYLDKVNAMRAAKKYWALEAVGMFIAEFKNGKIGTALVDKNGCVVPGTIMSGSLAEMKEIFKVVQSDHFFDAIGEAES